MGRFLAIAILVGACTTSAEGPPCDPPAPLTGQYDPRAPGFIVSFHDEYDADAETMRLAGIYGFVPTYISERPPMFAAEMSFRTLLAVRCEASVGAVEYNAVTSGD
jgi:hypothetical protein